MDITHKKVVLINNKFLDRIAEGRLQPVFIKQKTKENNQLGWTC